MRKIEQLLRLAGDLRKFENPAPVMDQDELTENELEFLAAAGTPEAMCKLPQDPDKKEK